MISNAARRPLTTRLRVKNGPEVRSSAAFVAQMVLAQASSWPSGSVPAQAGKLTCAESEVNQYFFDYDALCAFPTHVPLRCAINPVVSCHVPRMGSFYSNECGAFRHTGTLRDISSAWIQRDTRGRSLACHETRKICSACTTRGIQCATSGPLQFRHAGVHGDRLRVKLVPKSSLRNRWS